MEKKKQSNFLTRLNILFLIIFILFSVLIIQLGVIQILNGKEFRADIERTNLETIKVPTPRGKIYDRNYHVIADNQPSKAITYTPAKGTTAEQRLLVAKNLSELINVVPKGENPEMYFDKELTERDLKEYWYLLNKEKATNRLSVKKRANMDNGEQYNATLELITEEDISSFTIKDKEIIRIKKELDKAMELNRHIIKSEGVTKEEYAKVAENMAMVPGVNVELDWNRAYPYGSTIKSLLGTVTSHREGIPADKKEYFLSLGYSFNDRVGKSGLEQQYESILRGRKQQIGYKTNRQGDIIETKVVVEGQRGKDLILSIDMELQQTVDRIIIEELRKIIKKYPHDNRHMTEALAVVIEPKTGELLAVSGQHYNREKDTFENVAYKTIYEQHIPGSAVKGATVLAGLQSGVVVQGETFYDKPMKIKGTPEKSSYTNSTLGWLNEIDALKESSNIYMFNIALRMGGEYNYQYNMPVTFNMDAFQEMRNYFYQFGLGVETGVDFPNEATGYKGTDPVAGNLMDFAIGQYDTYTTMQLAQYVSTIANDGLRVKPHFLKEVRNPNTSDETIGSVYKNMNTEAINRIEMDLVNIKRVQEGFRRVFQEPRGTAFAEFHDKKYNAVGKTGTAENEFEGDYTENLTLISYAPMENPEVALAIVVPHAGQGEHVNAIIGERILDAYFDMK
ncbi:penicillin-binding protein 2 [Ornithinibacillus sp. BX22]|uniref:serine-type D-Ala-D-Ala carboxypeptidase n=1 Tax=Ornithinibacillus hominis TaxID=2763055 RepID=A0A923L815_9BACI|nr:penicillin-binding protein 2 [Ornithinibacillus hominis]MBC5638235.1 penicillin-binding protein 2 [Ornithinibacillus hominis]